LTQLFRQEVINNSSNRLDGEVILTQSMSSRLMVLAIFVVISITVLWLFLGAYSRIESASGILATDAPSSKIVATVSGLVSQLEVSEGSRVRAGDRLAVVNIEKQATIGLGAASVGVASIETRIGLGNEQMRLSLDKQINEQERLRSVQSFATAQIASLTDQINLQRQVVESNKLQFDQIGNVVERGFVSRFDYERRRQTYLNSQQSLKGLEQQIISQRSQAAQAQSQLIALASDGARDVNDLRSSMAALTQQRAQFNGEKSYVLKAPITGIVTAIQMTVGGVIAQNSPAMTIIPEDARLHADVYAPSRAIGLVHPGQEVRLLYEAFPYQRFGSFKGVIASVSRVVIDPRETLIPIKIEEPVYKVTVRLERQVMQAYGQSVPLQPGMALIANIVLERQSFLDWLLTPLRAVINRS
jgi:membrane fusion protein